MSIYIFGNLFRILEAHPRHNYLKWPPAPPGNRPVRSGLLTLKTPKTGFLVTAATPKEAGGWWKRAERSRPAKSVELTEQWAVLKFSHLELTEGKTVKTTYPSVYIILELIGRKWKQYANWVSINVYWWRSKYIIIANFILLTPAVWGEAEIIKTRVWRKRYSSQLRGVENLCCYIKEEMFVGNWWFLSNLEEISTAYLLSCFG